MSIIDFKSHAKHIAYTMTLAAGGFAYIDTKYDDGKTLFGLNIPCPIPLATIVEFFALMMFFIALFLGVMAIFGLSGLNQLTAHKENLKSDLATEIMKREKPKDAPTAKETSISKSIENTNKKIESFVEKLKKRSDRHLVFLGIGLLSSALLFADAKLDPNPSLPKCQLEVDEEGKLMLPVACIPQPKK